MIKSRIFAWIGLLLAYLIIAVAIFRCLDVDAFISFRYIDQLCAGNGLVFNQGIKVEGFSNFLWIVLLLPFKAMGGSLIICSRLLGMFFCAGTAVLIILFTKKNYLAGKPAAVLCGLLVHRIYPRALVESKRA